jgi:hypothetical protein
MSRTLAMHMQSCHVNVGQQGMMVFACQRMQADIRDDASGGYPAQTQITNSFIHLYIMSVDNLDPLRCNI